MPGSTPRYDIPYPLGTDPTDGPGSFQDGFDAIDAIMATAQAVSTLPAAGLLGIIYHRTTDDTYYFDNGTSLVPIPGMGGGAFFSGSMGPGFNGNSGGYQTLFTVPLTVGVWKVEVSGATVCASNATVNSTSLTVGAATGTGSMTIVQEPCEGSGQSSAAIPWSTQFVVTVTASGNLIVRCALSPVGSGMNGAIYTAMKVA